MRYTFDGIKGHEMPTYKVIARSEATLNVDRSEGYTSFTLTTVNRDKAPQVPGDFVGGAAEIWNGYAGQGEDFKIISATGSDTVLLQKQPNQTNGNSPGESMGPFELTGAIDVGRWLELKRNGTHRFKVLSSDKPRDTK